jgi:hypothetical protein
MRWLARCLTRLSGTFDLIARLNPCLDETELVLMSHAVDNQDDVLVVVTATPILVAAPGSRTPRIGDRLVA